MPLSQGDKLGPYEILAPIGKGGMGEVYKARDTRLDRIVALKVSAAQFGERFEREAKAIAALNHPNICQIYDVGPNYLVMEYIEGTPVKGPLPLEKAVEYAGQILDALDAAHQKAITHRDLKPANILVSKAGIKLLDFGLAKQTGPVKETDATMTKGLTGQGQIVGTLQYMSPEQLLNKDVDPRSDLFALGCVLYEMLTGKRAFEGQSAASVIAAILEREPAPLNLGPPLERVIRKSLAKEPDQRFQTARDLKTALLWAVEQQVVAAPQTARRWQWIAAAAVLIGALVGGLAVARFWQPFAASNNRVLRFHLDPPEGGQFVFGANSGGAAASPDGRTVAYVATVKGVTALWVRPLDGAARMLAGTEGAFFPFWSPDSKSIAFFIPSKLMRVDLAGGAPLVICDVAAGRGGAWSSDGRIIYGAASTPLLQVAASGGTPKQLTQLKKGSFAHVFPQVLPGGRFLYIDTVGLSERVTVYAASFAKPTEPVSVLENTASALFAPGEGGRGYLLRPRGGTLVAQEFDPATLKLSGEARAVADVAGDIQLGSPTNASSSASGLLLYGSAGEGLNQFTWMDRAGKQLGTLGEPGDFREYNFRFSPDGRRLAATKGRQLWMTDVERGFANRFSFAPGLNLGPVWSPDGRTVVFAAAKNNLFRKDSSGAGAEERLTQSENNQYPQDWSRDGRWLLYYEITAEGKRHLWVLPMVPNGKAAPGSKPRLYLRSNFNESLSAFAPEPEQRWVAYESDESGRPEIYIQAFPEPKGKFQISSGGGQQPEWNPAAGNGRQELLYVSADGRLMSVSVKLSAESVEASAPRELFPLPDRRYRYTVAPDGKRFLVLAPAEASPQPLNVIVNWPALVK